MSIDFRYLYRCLVSFIQNLNNQLFNPRFRKGTINIKNLVIISFNFTENAINDMMVIDDCILILV